MSPFEAGKQAGLSGKTENDNPHIIGKTALGNNRLSEDGVDWLNGFNSTKTKVAGKKEMAAAASVDITRFRRKSNRFYQR